MLRSRSRVRRTVVVAVAGALLAVAPVVAPAAGARPPRPAGRYLVRTAPVPAGAAARARLQTRGREVRDLAGIGLVAVELGAGEADTLAGTAGVTSVVPVGVRSIGRPEGTTAPTAPARRQRPGAGTDPASARRGLTWNRDRVGAADANAVTSGVGVTVAVLDTGIDPTHRELAGRLGARVDLSDGTLCGQVLGPTADITDADLAAELGGPADGDWNGHGTWMAGTIAANVDGQGVQGLAPGVRLVDLKVAQWCGFAADDALLQAIVWAADRDVDVVNLAFGGYLDTADPDQAALVQTYADAVAYARARGTLVVVSAGNEHVRLGTDGRVTSHGQLAAPGEDLPDLFGLTAVPAGLPGVVTVAATNNVTVGASRGCRVAAGDIDAVCKPLTDRHQPTGVGRLDQLAYYSNYGPRIDIAAPGGSGKFNLPLADGGGTLGFPWTRADGFTAFGTFSITSNWAQDVPCFVNVGVGYHDQCYTTIQGTSMAAPHVAAAAALVIAARPALRNRPAAIVRLLQAGATAARNATPPLSATDTSAGDLTGAACPRAYCHLGGPAISDAEAYGAGVVHAGRSVALALR